MQTCYNCGKSVPDETLICPDCGALVRRYSPPPKPEEAAPVWQPEPAPAPSAQKVRLYGGVRVWLIILNIVTGYLAVSTLCAAYGLSNLDLFRQLADEPGMEASADMFNELLLLLEQMRPLLPVYILLGVVYLCKLAVHIWLLKSGRRLPFFISLGLSVGAYLGTLLLGGGFLSFVNFIDPALTWPLLRRFWPWMQK